MRQLSDAGIDKNKHLFGIQYRLGLESSREHHLAKGTVYLMIAQVIFLAGGYVIPFVAKC